MRDTVTVSLPPGGVSRSDVVRASLEECTASGHYGSA
jgi:hypothetical protein